MRDYPKNRRKNRKIRRCPRCPSCFECPEPDCVEDGKYGYNEILTDRFYDTIFS